MKMRAIVITMRDTLTDTGTVPKDLERFGTENNFEFETVEIVYKMKGLGFAPCKGVEHRMK